jgi:hypothetical protein
LIDNHGITKSDLEKYFKIFVEIIKKLQASNEKTIGNIDGRYSDEVKKVGKNLTSEITKFFAQEAKKVRAGRDGKDGVSPDATEVASYASKLTLDALLPQIPTLDSLLEKLPEFGEKCRDGLELLQDEDRLDASAIKNLDEYIKVRMGGVSGGGVNMTAVSLHIVDDETPSGDINGVNTDFVIDYVPSPSNSLKVYKDGQRMKLAVDYTFTGQTITFLSAPLTDSIITCDYRR